MLSHCAELKFALRVDHQPERLESFPKSTYASSCGFATGSVRNRMASINWKIAVFAPIPRASDITATAVNVGFRRSCRSPNLRSLISASIVLVLILRTTTSVTTVCKRNGSPALAQFWKALHQLPGCRRCGSNSEHRSFRIASVLGEERFDVRFNVGAVHDTHVCGGDTAASVDEVSDRECVDR